MGKLMEYKGYHAQIEYSNEDKCLIGKVVNINDTILFDGKSVTETEEAFFKAIDEYLDFCKESNKEPEKEYKGTFNIRISPDLHRSVALAAAEKGISLNQFVGEALHNYALQR